MFCQTQVWKQWSTPSHPVCQGNQKVQFCSCCHQKGTYTDHKCWETTYPYQLPTLTLNLIIHLTLTLNLIIHPFLKEV
jgi:hypothetical protein